MDIRKHKAIIIAIAVILILAVAAFVIFRRPNAWLINSDGRTVVQRFNVPEGFERVLAPEGSFGRFLQELPLLPDGA